MVSLGEVDLIDQNTSTNPYSHKVQKWHHAIFYFIKDAAIINSYIVHCAVVGVQAMDFSRFKEKLLDKFVSFVPKRKTRKCGRHSLQRETELPAKLTERHFPTSYEHEKYRPDCIVCSRSRDYPRRKQTRFAYMQCKDNRDITLPICLPDCFTR